MNILFSCNISSLFTNNHAIYIVYGHFVTMYISLLTTKIQTENHINKKVPRAYPNLSPLTCDAVSFGAMKKVQFDGVDFAVIEKFKAPIEKFNTNQDLQNWAKTKTDEIKNKNFGGRQKETKIQRKAILKEWTDYVTKENIAYNNAAALLILTAITKNLAANNDKLPPVLNKGILADCIYEIDKNMKHDKKYNFDLNKMYETKLRLLFLEDTKTGETDTKWVIIPSKKNDPANFEKNVEKLKALSYKSWCTKSYNAEPYLKRGDFNIYLENGQPKIGIKFIGDEIAEIQGEPNNGKIPIEYAERVKQHIEENDYKIRYSIKKELSAIEKADKEVKKFRKDLKTAIEKNDAKTIFEYFKIKAEEDENGLLTIAEFKQPSENYTYSYIGIDENKLFEKIKKITKNADFENSKVTNLGNLESIEKNAVFRNARITNTGKLQSIGGYANFRDSEITNLGNLVSIGKSAEFTNSKITSLGNLKFIGAHAFFGDSQITDLGNLEFIGKEADFVNSQITSLGNLKYIGEHAYFNNSRIANLGNLKFIGGNAIFSNSQITRLGNLESIGGKADFTHSKITNLENLKSVGENVYLKFSKLKPEDFKNVEIKGSIEIL